MATLATPCPKPVADLGYRRELIALQTRAKRCEVSWAPHLAATRSTIRAAVARTQRRRLVVVLGAGSLYDIPLELLAANFTRVILVDILHLRTTRNIATQLPNVDLYTSDLTGLIDQLHALSSFKKIGRKTLLPHPPGLPLPVDAADIDLTISANLLSQLPIPAWYWIKDKLPGTIEQVLDRYAADIIEAHVSSLQTLPGTVCLITDYQRHYINRTGAVFEREDALFAQNLPAHPKGGWREWMWDAAPIGELDRNWALRRLVRATPEL